MKHIINFLLTLVVFIGAWKLFPEYITANSYGDCVLATIVFFISGTIISWFCVFSMLLMLKFPNIGMVAIFIACIVICFACVPLGILAATHFTNYAIVGKLTFILFWFVLGLLTVRFNSKNERNWLDLGAFLRTYFFL